MYVVEKARRIKILREYLVPRRFVGGMHIANVKHGGCSMETPSVAH